MLAVVLAILAKPVVILKLGLRSISKRITSLIFLDNIIAADLDNTIATIFEA